MSSEDNFGKSLVRAFRWHWHLLALGGGIAFAFLSGQPEIFLPLVAAGEIGYLGFLGTNRRFQNVLKGQELLEGKGAARAEAEEKSRLAYERLIAFLDPEDAQKFGNLRERCAELTRLQHRMAGQGSGDGGSDGSSRFRAESLDKLLWLYLKLLHQKSGIGRFLQSTDRDSLEAQRERTREEVESARAAGRSERLTSSLVAKLTTIEDRLANYDEAVLNAEIVTAEIGKTEQKIAHVCEVGMTSRDPSALSRQIDGISESVSLAEETLGGFDIGLAPPSDELAPAFVSVIGEDEAGAGSRVLESE